MIHTLHQRTTQKPAMSRTPHQRAGSEHAMIRTRHHQVHPESAMGRTPHRRAGLEHAMTPTAHRRANPEPAMSRMAHQQPSPEPATTRTPPVLVCYPPLGPDPLTRQLELMMFLESIHNELKRRSVWGNLVRRRRRRPSPVLIQWCRYLRGWQEVGLLHRWIVPWESTLLWYLRGTQYRRPSRMTTSCQSSTTSRMSPHRQPLPTSSRSAPRTRNHHLDFSTGNTGQARPSRPAGRPPVRLVSQKLSHPCQRSSPPLFPREDTPSPSRGKRQVGAAHGDQAEARRPADRWPNPPTPPATSRPKQASTPLQSTPTVARTSSLQPRTFPTEVTTTWQQRQSPLTEDGTTTRPPRCSTTVQADAVASLPHLQTVQAEAAASLPDHHAASLSHQQSAWTAETETARRTRRRSPSSEPSPAAASGAPPHAVPSAGSSPKGSPDEARLSNTTAERQGRRQLVESGDTLPVPAEKLRHELQELICQAMNRNRQSANKLIRTIVSLEKTIARKRRPRRGTKNITSPDCHESSSAPVKRRKRALEPDPQGEPKRRRKPAHPTGELTPSADHDRGKACECEQGYDYGSDPDRPDRAGEHKPGYEWRNDHARRAEHDRGHLPGNDPERSRDHTLDRSRWVDQEQGGARVVHSLRNRPTSRSCQIRIVEAGALVRPSELAGSVAWERHSETHRPARGRRSVGQNQAAGWPAGKNRAGWRGRRSQQTLGNSRRKRDPPTSRTGGFCGFSHRVPSAGW